MALLGGLADVYIISTAIGSIYLAFSAAMGHLGGDAGHGGEGLGHGHAHSVGSHSSTGGHAQLGHDSGHGSGHDSGHGDAPSDGSTDTGSHPRLPSPLSSGHGHGHSGTHADPATGIVHAQPRFAGILPTLLTFLSPMTLSVFLAFFGLTGFVVIKLLPWLGLLTLVPAIVVAALVTQTMLRVFSWLLRSTDVSTVARMSEVIGQMAHISVPIKEGRTGEIVCEMGSKRYNFSAKALNSQQTFTSGARVIIADMRDGVAFVEPWDDVLLD